MAILRLLLATLPVFAFAQILDQTTYYPLNIGDWREYSAQVSYWDGIHYMKREGVVDTVTINGNLYYKQLLTEPFPAYGVGLYVREDSLSNVLYFNITEGKDDTLCKFDEYYVDYWGKEWIVNALPEYSDLMLYGNARPNYQSLSVPATGIMHNFAIQQNYRFESILDWRNDYVPGHGKVKYSTTDVSHRLERMKIEGVEYVGSYQSPKLDTLVFTPQDMTFSKINSKRGFKYSLTVDFAEHPYFYTNYSIEALAFRMHPKLDTYLLDWIMDFESRSQIIGHTESIKLDTTAYYDVVDRRYLPFLAYLSGTLTIRGGYTEKWLPDIDSTAIPDSFGVMSPEDFEVWVLLSDYTVSTEQEINVPESYHLNPVYPNPFNSTASIEFGIPVQGDTQIEIYNLLGQIIWTQPYTDLQSGNHKTTWDGTNMYGEDMDSGVYIVRASSSGWSESIRVALLK
ncbi:MAG: T9SS type A sorting domain-containing protein [Candidatus Marinimicrobia bacterium]|nr:T9SS type A sorting domain-containing protein [Candidatus Neomarinimicrobiota bacterium]MCF7904694.1 T9SS type A sorting domain-containing protein [Candidatus Neomarinimicrobiota bacterium]